jgi:Spy/CpxP family protein refolding chaperone
MRRKLIMLLVVLSVALNVAFIGGWAWHAFSGCLRTGRPQPGRDGEIWCPTHRELGLTGEQWRQIEPSLTEFYDQAQENRSRLQNLRDEILDLLAAPEPDMALVREKQEQILKGQRRMQELVLRRLLKEKEVLTAEQEKRLFSMLRRRMGCPLPGPMMAPGQSRGDGIGKAYRERKENRHHDPK